MKEIPESYYKEAEHQGTFVDITYDTKHYAGGREPIRKPARVYLPWGYEEGDREKRYNILYLIHGFGGNTTDYFGKDGSYTPLKHVVDHMIEDQILEPLIIVTPTLYPENRIMTFKKTVAETEEFTTELAKDLIPAVESRFHTYARSVDPQGIIESREHRAVGGFSLGGVTAWYVFMLELDYVKDYLPMSGDCWIMTEHGGLHMPNETSIALAVAAHQFECGPEDYRIFAYTGSQDVVYKDVSQQIEAMKRNYPNSFQDSNLYFEVKEGAVHDPAAFTSYLYDGLPRLFS